eukprot:s910_g24.t1
MPQSVDRPTLQQHEDKQMNRASQTLSSLNQQTILERHCQVKRIRSLRKVEKGHVDGVVVEMDAGSSCVEGWDYTWLPLVLADETGALYNAQTKEKEGWLRNLADGQILSARSESNSEGESADEDLFVFAADAEEASLARRRYGFAMSVLLMPPDPACWAVAAAGAKADRAVATAKQMAGGKTKDLCTLHLNSLVLF